MTGMSIVAIPRDDDYVWKLSSEKVPHLTIIDLGDLQPGPAVAQIESFMSHVANSAMYKFGLEVDYRGTLGPLSADVLFFDFDNDDEDDADMQMVAAARQAMLVNPIIKAAYMATTQYPEWTPHLTMGYPTAPAKEDTRDYPGINWVSFDRIALWTGDYEGPEVRLEDRDEAAWSIGASAAEKILEHHGVRGMKWGVRKAERSSPNVTIHTNPGKNRRVKTVGGKGNPIHEDAAKALIAKQKAKASGVHTLSNHELKTLVDRMNMEQQLKRLSGPNKGEAHKFVENQLKSVGQQKIQKLASK